MATEIKVPSLGESITEAVVGRWLKQTGDAVQADEPLVELETDKVTVEVNAPTDGVLAEILAEEGDMVEVGGRLGAISTAAAAVGAVSEPPHRSPAVVAPIKKAGEAEALSADHDMPAPSRIAAKTPAAASQSGDGARERRVPMTPLRQTIARRLKQAQNTAAMLTTFNEVDMSGVVALRREYGQAFRDKYQVKLGFMGLFVKACVRALQEMPVLNAEIDGTDIIYKDYYHIGIAVGTDRGLVVPVIRDADGLSLAEIETAIADFAARARAGKLALDELAGGTFTISNGGIYGSMLSTPILNTPQSGILGLHRIEERAVVVDGKVVARPMMYLALTYDHRVVDGREAVTFLVRVKQIIERPERLLLGI